VTSAASRSQRHRLGRLGRLVRHSWPSAPPLYTVLAVGTVLPALPAAAEISLFGIAFAQRVGRGGNAKLIGWQGNLVLAALLIPVLAVCAYLIARAWTAAAWLAAESSADHTVPWWRGLSAGYRSWAIWLRYLVGVCFLCLIAGSIADLTPDYRLPLAILISAGPLGLLSPLMLFASAQVSRCGRVDGAATEQVSTADLRGVVLVILIFHILVGAALAPAILSPGSWQVAAGLLAAFVLAVPTAVIIAVIGNSHYLDRS